MRTCRVKTFARGHRAPTQVLEDHVPPARESEYRYLDLNKTYIMSRRFTMKAHACLMPALAIMQTSFTAVETNIFHVRQCPKVENNCGTNPAQSRVRVIVSGVRIWSVLDQTNTLHDSSTRTPRVSTVNHPATICCWDRPWDTRAWATNASIDTAWCWHWPHSYGILLECFRERRCRFIADLKRDS